jgi:hypothetical protein
MVRKIIFAVVLLGLIGVGTGIYLWNKPHDKVEDRKGIIVSAKDLSAQYGADEHRADSLYLNKAIEVTGTVGETEQNQDGGVMMILETGDPMAGIQCAMREKGVKAEKGKTVTIKGFCSGSGITGVSLTDCIIKQ